MNRGRHYHRQGEAEGQTRELQANGSAQAHGPFVDAHADFAEPDPETYQGFAADGYWRETGAIVEAGLSNTFGVDNDGELNTLKWTAPTSPGAVADMKETYLELPYLVAGGSVTDTYAGRFELRGDFHIELAVTTTDMPAGTGAGAGQDMAVWLGVSRKSTPTDYWRAKKTRTDAAEGFAAEISGVGAQEGFFAAPNVDTFRLVLIRTAGNLEVRAYYEAHPDTLLWDGAVSGILNVNFAVQFIAAAANWTVRVSRFDHFAGWHSYSNQASWLREPVSGMVFDEFVGDEFDPDLWTIDENGDVTVTPGSEPGFTFANSSTGDASVTSPTITGDFTATIPMRWTRPDAHAPTGEMEEVATSVEVRPAPDGYPRIMAQIVLHHTEDPSTVETVRGRLLTQATAMDDPVEVATFNGFPVGPATQQGTFTITRRGKTFIVALFDDSAGVSRWSEIIDDMPSLAVSLVMRAEVAVGSTVIDATVERVRITSPHALALASWPTNYYAVGTQAGADEINDPGSNPILVEATLIDTAARVPFFRIVGNGEGGVNETFAQALPGGTVGVVWAEPADGILWIPCATPSGGSDEGFIEVDLRRDRIRKRRGGVITTFGGPISQRHLGHGYADITSATLISTAPPLMRAFCASSASDSTQIDVWVTATLVTLFRSGTKVQLWTNGTVGQVALLPPTTGEAALVVFGGDPADALLALYSTLRARLIAGGNEAAPGDSATVTFDHGDFGGLSTYAGGGLDAMRGPDGIMMALARGTDGGAVLAANGDVTTWDHDATPTAAELSAPPMAVRLALTPTLVAPGAGWAVFATADSGTGKLEVATLRAGTIRERIDYADAIEGFDSASSATTAGMIDIAPIPGQVGGLRVAVGLQTAGAVEIDLLTFLAGTWRGPHIGGTRFGWTGFGAESVIQVNVGGVRCFGARLTPSRLGRPPVFSAVNRAVGFIINDPPHPALTDEQLEEEPAPEWPQDVTITLNDGTVIVLEDAFTYYADPQIDQTARRMMRRLPEEVIDGDVKADHDWRHIAIAIAWGMRKIDTLFDNVEADQRLATATGVGLNLLSGSYDAVPPVELADADLRAYVAARAFGRRVTVKALKDILEPVLGYRPGVEEDYREFTIALEDPFPGLDGALDNNFYAELDPDEPLDLAFYGHSYYGGGNVEADATKKVVDVVRAAGVKPNVVIRGPD